MARDAALRLGASDAGVLEQTDTYFHCTSGRLKLRETVGRRAELIAYARPDRADVRASDYHVIPVETPEQLKRGLAAALGVRVVVSSGASSCCGTTCESIWTSRRARFVRRV
jgi:hypothetical protein